MFDDMRQFLSSETCLACEGCCRFDKEKSDWRPKAGESEERSIIAGLPPEKKIESRNIIEQGGYLKDKLCHGLYACEFFNPENSACQIYLNRPFECKLYPFVLTRWNNKPAVCVHLTCPFIEKEKGSGHYHGYVAYLKELFMTSDVIDLLKKNPYLFGRYQGYEHELEWVFDVALQEAN